MLLQLIRADFLERVRRHGFLVTLGFAVYAAFLFLPPNPSPYATLQLGGHRGIYNSAWVGCLVAMLSVSFLSLAGFYLVKNAVERDYRTGVGQILAATPISRARYLLGKLASNFLVLVAMVAVLAVAAGAMQLVRAEDPALRPLTLLAPFAVLTLPVMALVAALAVCFEVTPGLRGGAGNVVYFFLWAAAMSASVEGPGGALDPLGRGIVLGQMQAACAAAFPGYSAGDGFSMGFNIRREGPWELRTFVWPGATWTPAALAGRAAWVAVAVGLTLLVAPLFDRFDASPAGAPGRSRTRLAAAPGWAPAARRAGARGGIRLPGPAAPGGLAGLAVAELRIMLQGVSRWWSLVALGVAVACVFAPLPIVRGFLMPFAMIWPLLRWSPLGSREGLHRTREMLFSTPRPLARLLAAQWLAGAALALAAAGGALVRFALCGEWESLLALLAAVAFIPSLALALGTWSGSGKLFEILYLFLWYGGPMSRVPFLDYLGAGGPGGGIAPAAVVLALGAILSGLAVAGRRRQLAR